MSKFLLSATNSINNTDHTAEIEIFESGCFKYGNQKGMSIRWNKSEMVDGYDIRYDTRYSSKDELGYVKKFFADEFPNLVNVSIEQEVSS